MKMDKIAGSGNDEFYTPLYAIVPLKKYISPGIKVWCPFDKDESLIVKEFSKTNPVINTHLDYGEDFFKIAVDSDIIISNPPYSLKNEVFERLFSLGRPFAMLVGVVGLFESQRRFELFRDNPFEVMYLNRRVSYLKSYEDEHPALNPPFSSVWLTSKVLPSPLVFEEITKR